MTKLSFAIFKLLRSDNVLMFVLFDIFFSEETSMQLFLANAGSRQSAKGPSHKFAVIKKCRARFAKKNQSKSGATDERIITSSLWSDNLEKPKCSHVILNGFMTANLLLGFRKIRTV